MLSSEWLWHLQRQIEPVPFLHVVPHLAEEPDIGMKSSNTMSWVWREQGDWCWVGGDTAYTAWGGRHESCTEEARSKLNLESEPHACSFLSIVSSSAGSHFGSVSSSFLTLTSRVISLHPSPHI